MFLISYVTFSKNFRTIWVKSKRERRCVRIEDAKIIELFFNRNEDAIAETDRSYGRQLFSLSDRILFSPEDAEECVSDTYLKAWKSIPPQCPHYLFAFLASICRHLTFHKLDWKTARKRSGEVISLSEEMAQCIPDEAREREMAGRELGKILNAFLESLPTESRLIFLRRYWYVDTISEIAARYGIGESKVKMQLSRTREKLRVYLAKEGITV